MARGHASDHEAYLSSLLAEATQWSAPGVSFDTVYFGGGTPSALLPDQIEKILAALGSAFDLSPEVHVTLELNPEDVDRRRSQAWQGLGVGSVSLGVQSLDDDELRFLGRRHSKSEALAACSELLSTGFDSVSLDLIYGLPGSDQEQWRDRLNLLPEVDHMSCYELTIHEGTPFARLESAGRLRQIADEEKASWFNWVRNGLEERGLRQYEVSNFARGGAFQSRHNAKYWQGLPYLGLGPAAHSFDGLKRWSNQPAWKAWSSDLAVGVSPVVMRETLDPADRVLEDVMLRLRTLEGINLEQFAARHGFDLLQRNREAFERNLKRGFLRLEGGNLRPTPEGLLMADRLALEFA